MLPRKDSRIWDWRANPFLSSGILGFSKTFSRENPSCWSRLGIQVLLSQKNPGNVPMPKDSRGDWQLSIDPGIFLPWGFPGFDSAWNGIFATPNPRIPWAIPEIIQEFPHRKFWDSLQKFQGFPEQFLRKSQDFLSSSWENLGFLDRIQEFPHRKKFHDSLNSSRENPAVPSLKILGFPQLFQREFLDSLTKKNPGTPWQRIPGFLQRKSQDLLNNYRQFWDSLIENPGIPSAIP